MKGLSVAAGGHEARGRQSHGSEMGGPTGREAAEAQR